jgi:RimJ/RimL family protein N-acetyltransferase
MQKALIKGDEVRNGAMIILDSVSKDVISSLGDHLLPEAIVCQVNDGSIPLFPMTAQDIVQSDKNNGELVFAIRLLAENTVIGVCRLSDIDWKSRHAQLHISIVEEAYSTSAMFVDVIQTMLQFAYWEANLNRISMQCLEDHMLLQEALDEVGFTDEGRLRQDTYRNGGYVDKVVYGILRREWSG